MTTLDRSNLLEALMQASDAFWHIANFLAPALFVGGLAAATTRFIWRRELARAHFLRLWAWASTAAAAASVGGLLVFEHDGRMLTYGTMVVSCAGALWWAGFRGAAR